MKTKKSIYIYSLLIMLCVMSSCSKNESTNPTIVEKDIFIPEHIKQTLDSHLIVDANITPPHSQTVYSYPATLNIFEPATINNVLFDNIGEEYDNGSDSVKIVQSEDANSMFSTILWFQSMDYITYLNALFGSMHFEDNSETLFQHCESLLTESQAKDLETFTPESAKDTIRDKANSLNIELAPEPYVFFAIDKSYYAEMLQKVDSNELFWDHINKFDIDVNWNTDDECYYMLWNIECHGENIFTGNYSQNVNGIAFLENGSTLFACISKKELVCFQIERTYSVAETGSLEGSILPIEDLLEHIKYEYRNLILDTDVTITRIEFCMAPILTNADTLEYIMTPVWSVLAEKKVEYEYETFTRGTSMLFHAVTGERIR
ncbi:hypothetical protein [Anaerosporobacter sp.]|uniref:hypothetical protein n=1 Tax=Anaerosporobacter sp. TaxID=1872529 RepID=UPI00286FA672|nr:hypothetical protein [Anaerosporobacter sp.]